MPTPPSRLIPLSLLLPLAAAPLPADPIVVLDPFEVRVESARDDIIQAPFAPEVVGTAIYAGKKAAVIDFDALPQIQVDNYRQAFICTPGLLTSEVSNASLLSLSHRGIGDPHETQNLLVLRDGLPFVLDPFGYPTVYFAPPFESLDRLEFIRGGAALLFGPQPSGALNYITHAPRTDTPLAATTQHLVGSHGLYSTFSTLEGTSGPVGYALSYDHRSGDGPRDHNSDFRLDGVTGRLLLGAFPADRVWLDVDLYRSDHGEPGGLTRARGPDRANIDDDPAAATTRHDRVRLQRATASLGWDHSSGSTLVSTRLWTAYVERWSRRENGQGFGTMPTGRLTVGTGAPAVTYEDSNTIADHEYRTLAAEVRVRHDAALQGLDRAIFTAGTTLLAVDAPIENAVGSPPDADTGPPIYLADRSSRSASLFAEALLGRGAFTLVPAFRLELLRQSVDEALNAAKTWRPVPNPLASSAETDVEPLFGLGAEWDLGPTAGRLFANISQAWKPKTYADAVPAGGADIVSADLEPGHVLQAEVGWRGQPSPALWWETSVFAIDYDDRFGRVGPEIRNVGRSLNVGWDAAAECDLLAAWRGDLVAPAAAPSGAVPAPPGPQLVLHANVQLLHAEFTAGPLDGRTPAYAPDVLARAGLVWRQPGRAKVALLATHLSSHFADDANTRTATADWLVPAYTVLDLTTEVVAWEDRIAGRPARLTVLAGVNNLLDASYTSRIRSNGIDPAAGRTAYAGFRLEL